jgi:hypothetical protein
MGGHEQINVYEVAVTVQLILNASKTISMIFFLFFSPQKGGGEYWAG